jgi:hypothetical protein
VDIFQWLVKLLLKIIGCFTYNRGGVAFVAGTAVPRAYGYSLVNVGAVPVNTGAVIVYSGAVL